MKDQATYSCKVRYIALCKMPRIFIMAGKNCIINHVCGHMPWKQYRPHQAPASFRIRLLEWYTTSPVGWSANLCDAVLDSIQ